MYKKGLVIMALTMALVIGPSVLAAETWDFSYIKVSGYNADVTEFNTIDDIISYNVDKEDFTKSSFRGYAKLRNGKLKGIARLDLKTDSRSQWMYVTSVIDETKGTEIVNEDGKWTITIPNGRYYMRLPMKYNKERQRCYTIPVCEPVYEEVERCDQGPNGYECHIVTIPTGEETCENVEKCVTYSTSAFTYYRKGTYDEMKVEIEDTDGDGEKEIKVTIKKDGEVFVEAEDMDANIFKLSLRRVRRFFRRFWR